MWRICKWAIIAYNVCLQFLLHIGNASISPQILPIKRKERDISKCLQVQCQVWLTLSANIISFLALSKISSKHKTSYFWTNHKASSFLVDPATERQYNWYWITPNSPMKLQISASAPIYCLQNKAKTWANSHLIPKNLCFSNCCRVLRFKW